MDLFHIFHRNNRQKYALNYIQVQQSTLTFVIFAIPITEY